MQQALREFFNNSTPAGRCLIGIALSWPFFPITVGLLAWRIDSFGKGIAHAIAAVAERDQQERLEAVLDYILGECCDPNVCGIFAEAWVLAKHLSFAMRLIDRGA